MRSVLDTCVLSELVKPKPEPRVVAWVRKQDEHQLFLSVITIGELHKGIAKLPEGTKRARLERWVAQELSVRFHRRILPVDAEIAAAWGTMLGQAESRGEPLPVVDALIAATAEVNDCSVITRNAGHLEKCGVTIVNPWE